MTPERSLLITDLTPAAVREHVARDSRLIIPLGACDQYGPHLPIGAATAVAEAFADQLSRDFDVLRSPAIPFGVNVPFANGAAGAASVREKTLHAFLNDLLASWEAVGFDEFVLITVHDHDPHVEAVATVTRTHARVRVVEALNMDLAPLLSGPAVAEHGGEVLTSLMLFLYPGKAQMDLAVDFSPEDDSIPRMRRMARIPEGSPGSLGFSTLASAETGRLLFAHICERIRTRVFSAPE